MTLILPDKLFHLDRLSIILMALVIFIGVCVGSFAYRYLKGDTQYRPFFFRLAVLIGSVIIMVSADHLLLLLIAWCLSNGLLVRLMIYKKNWKAAKAAGLLATKNFVWGAIWVASAFVLFYTATGETSIQALVHQPTLSSTTLLALGLLLMGAMTQSAIWPFHRWLLSSLNSPTPVSAIMHAGLINGGGFLLARFAPLYLQSPALLTVLVVLGFCTALLGTLWKLMQPDVKRMLACSTMGQMGFMVVQCGLGLFPAAVAHLVWHGLFKAYLFLSSGSAAQEKRVDLRYPPGPVAFSCALVCGSIGSFCFAISSGKAWMSGDTTLVLIGVAFLTASQFALPMLQSKPLQRLPLALIGTGLFGLVYGAASS
ncbi:proton-conducting membrane transporter [Spirosoma sp. HMF3257]|uniref:Proton-conducting membrane transporter n=1 Tax=Spirosoma telluris TaxID=2183553 RepID=A0A327NPJ1_9BACT|nr:proton-conducting membrane transporter [Spirosoma telluris]RAI75714.1 proton-conducting membrane transporter [Spirosoma telluris]